VNWKVQSAPTGNALTDTQTYQFAEVAHLYDAQDPYRIETYERRANEVCDVFDTLHRNQLADALHDYMHALGASSRHLRLLETLRQADTVVVVTGQQAGLFTGPMYAVSKALSAIGVAKSMSEKLGRPVLPVFWIASEDHDWAEVNHAYVLDASDDVKRISVPVRIPAHQMVYHTSLPAEAVEDTLRQVHATLPEGLEKASMMSEIRAAYSPGMSLSTWFAKVLLMLLQAHDIILLDPCLPALRKLVAPVWVRALQNAQAVQENLRVAYQAVADAGYTPEVVRDETNSTLFYVEDGARYVLELTPSGRLRARGHGLEQSLEAWIALAQDNPSAFSSNVLLRPVVQDCLLPTLVYVGGPSEIAYHPLSRAVFRTHGRTLPPLLMRQRVTWFLPSVLRNMKKWDVAEDEILVQPDLVTPVLDSFGAKLIAEEFATLKSVATAQWSAWSAQHEALGPQVDDMVQAHVRRELSLIETLERKTQMLLTQRHDAEVRQLRHIERWLWTDGHPQERHLCPLNIWAKFGLDIFGQVPTWGDLSTPAPVYHMYIS